jgi:hypothetical protein
MARVSICADQAPPAAQFEIIFGGAPSPSEFSSALESLSVGCSLCGQEIKMLLATAVAERYLALRGRGARPADRPNKRTPIP